MGWVIFLCAIFQNKANEIVIRERREEDLTFSENIKEVFRLYEVFFFFFLDMQHFWSFEAISLLCSMPCHSRKHLLHSRTVPRPLRNPFKEGRQMAPKQNDCSKRCSRMREGMESHQPRDTLQHFERLLNKLSQAEKITKKQMQSLIAHLNFAYRNIPLGTDIPPFKSNWYSLSTDENIMRQLHAYDATDAVPWYSKDTNLSCITWT